LLPPKGLSTVGFSHEDLSPHCDPATRRSDAYRGGTFTHWKSAASKRILDVSKSIYVTTHHRVEHTRSKASDQVELFAEEQRRLGIVIARSPMPLGRKPMRATALRIEERAILTVPAQAKLLRLLSEERILRNDHEIISALLAVRRVSVIRPFTRTRHPSPK